jgi:hypothetical protein
MRLVESVHGRTGVTILIAERDDGEAAGFFRMIGKIGHHADLSFNWYDHGPHEIVFPMVDGWPTPDQAQRIVNTYNPS